MNLERLIAEAGGFHPWDAMAPAALAAIARRAPFERTAETGCGGSTIVLSHCSRHHTAFAIEGEHQTITELRGHESLAAGKVNFVAGPSKETLPAYSFDSPLDLILLDGPHAYPLPQLEFAYLTPRLRVGGWLVLDDLQIPSVHELFQFAKREAFLSHEETVVRTAFFRKVGDPDFGMDGWWLQGINRSRIWRYSWRDRLREWVRGKGR